MGAVARATGCVLAQHAANVQRNEEQNDSSSPWMTCLSDTECVFASGALLAV